jgi:hypothetical protein
MLTAIEGFTQRAQTITVCIWGSTMVFQDHGLEGNKKNRGDPIFLDAER